VERVNVGMIGAGFMGKAHSAAYAAMPMFFWPPPAMPHRKAIADVTDELAAEAATRFGFETSTGDWRRLVEDPSIQVVDIASPNNTHPEIAIAAAEAGKHIICEKPLACTVAEAEAMVEAVKRAGVVNMVAYNYRRTPAVALAKQFIAEGRIGRVLSFRGQYMCDWSADPDVPMSWRFQKAVAGSGSLGDIGSHVLDMARYLVGEVASVNGVTRTVIEERPVQEGPAGQLGAPGQTSAGSRQTVDVDDEVLAMLRFENGAIGSLEASRNVYGRNNFLTFEVRGSEGTIAFNYERNDELDVFFASDPADARGFRTIYTGPQHPYGDGLWPVPGIGIGYTETKIIECRDLMAAIVGGTQVEPSFEDGLRVARISQAIEESSATGSWIDLTAGVAV
jgi:predicted dehydrogenase